MRHNITEVIIPVSFQAWNIRFDCLSDERQKSFQPIGLQTAKTKYLNDFKCLWNQFKQFIKKFFNVAICHSPSPLQPKFLDIHVYDTEDAVFE